jgi:TrmH family RNA methyltransferase
MSSNEFDAAPGFSPDVLTERSARIVAAHKLLRRARRTETGEFLADGAQAVREAVAAERDAPGTVRELYVTAEAAGRQVTIVRAALDRGIPVTEVNSRAAEKLSGAVTPQGITARCALPDGLTGGLASLLGGRPQLLAVLVETSDPGNAGTIIRLADAAGADAVIVAGDTVDAFGPKTVRASAGSVFHLPIVRAPHPETLLASLAGAGIRTLATTGAAELTLPEADASGLLAGPTAWLFGNEAHGLARGVIDDADRSIRIPIYGRAESLNLAAAAAICLYASATAQRR